MEGVPSFQTFSLFELVPENPLIAGLSLCNNNGRSDLPEDVKPSEIPASENTRIVIVPEISDRMSCSACQCSFDNREEQKEHYTLDWHRFNLKRRIRGAAALGSEEFQEKTQAGDLSSISGSDSESDRDEGSAVIPDPDVDPGSVSHHVTRSQRCFFKNGKGQFLSAYRCVLGQTRDSVVEAEQLVNCVQSMREPPVVIILMAGGGHFAGAVYRGKEVLQHKTFHRYTVRAKRGTSQALHDAQNRSHMAKSAGAALRRYNQAALITEITQLLQSWAEHVKEAWGIFLRTPRSDRTLFLGRNSPIPSKDPRVHGIPFITRRATFREVQRVHSQLFTLRVYDKDLPSLNVAGAKVKNPKSRGPARTEPKDEKPVSYEEDEPLTVHLVTEELTLSTLDLREFELQPKRKRKKRKDVKVPDNSKEPHGEEDAEKGNPRPLSIEELPGSVVEGDELYQIRNSLFTCCKTGDSQNLRQILQDLPQLSVELPSSVGSSSTAGETESLVNERLSPDGRTMLHVAASSGHGEVACLLMDAGWDPALRDSAGQTPYSLSPDKTTRNTFRRYREENPEKYNYTKSQIPAPVSEEAEAQRAKKKQAYKAQRKQREKEEKEERKRKEQEEAEKKRFAALSDREKRALAAERRLAAQLSSANGTENKGRRCWQCGESLLGKVPFEYLDFSFCTTQCLQEHRRSKITK